jgi:tryptophanyl-tRNA synthetase
MTIFSGIQPTGNITIGNYLGAIKNWVEMQKTENGCIFCIVDSHAITVPQDPNILKEAILTTLAAYIASGIDAEKSIVYNQSKVHQHTELAWIFNCITPIGWLNRMTQFKDKAGKNKEKASAGLYTYPVLMAADILLFHADKVPVGEDQKQHVELARDIAGAFNRRFDVEYFSMPEFITNKTTTRIMSLRDGTKKMSKSDPSDMSRINLTDDNDTISKKIRKATTDSIEGIYFDEEQRPEVSNLINIYAAFTGKSIAAIVEHFTSKQNNEFKQELIDIIIAEIQPIREKIIKLRQHDDHLKEILGKNAEKAGLLAEKTIQEVRDLVGFL